MSLHKKKYQEHIIRNFHFKNTPIRSFEPFKPLNPVNSPAFAGLQRAGERRTRQLRCGLFGPQAGDTLEDQRMWGPRGIAFDPKFTWQILLGLGYSERV